MWITGRTIPLKFEVVRYVREFPSVANHAMVRHRVQWRMEHHVDSFLDTYRPPPLFYQLPVFLCQGLDRQNDPIYVERFGVGDQYGLVRAHGGNLEPLAHYTLFVREITTTRRRQPHCTNNQHRYCWQRDYYEPLTQRRLTRFIAIMDMQGLIARNIRGGLLGLLQRMARISQDHYAGMAKRVLILRAPAIFEGGWNTVVKLFLDDTIQKLILVTTADDYLDVMEHYIDLTVLPECLAPGHGQGKVMPGYFERVRLQGGLIQGLNDDTDSRNNHDPSMDHFQPLRNDVALPTQQQQQQQATDMNTCPCSSSRVSVTAGSLLKGKWDDSSVISTEDTLSTELTAEDSLGSTMSSRTEVTVLGAG